MNGWFVVLSILAVYVIFFAVTYTLCKFLEIGVYKSYHGEIETFTAAIISGFWPFTVWIILGIGLSRKFDHIILLRSERKKESE